MQKNRNFKRKSWFENKKCDICGKQGTIFRYFDKSKQVIICDNSHCDLVTRVRAGFFGGIKIKGVK